MSGVRNVVKHGEIDPLPPDPPNGDESQPSDKCGGDRPEQLSRMELLAQLAALHGKMAALPVIEQAKGALMVTYGISADEAFAVLRSHSQHRNVKIRAIAAHLTAAVHTSPTNPKAISRLERLLTDSGDRPATSD